MQRHLSYSGGALPFWGGKRMYIQSRAVGAELRQSTFPSQHQSRRIPTLVSVVVLLCFGLTMLTLSAVAAARTRTISQFPDLPQAYLPGNPLPREVSCHAQSYGYDGCSVHFGG